MCHARPGAASESSQVHYQICPTCRAAACSQQMCAAQYQSGCLGEIRNWIKSDECEKWSVKLNVLDLGGHLDSTERQLASTLAGRAVIVLSVIVAVCV